jgi:Holliday junction resolvasome RuvABC endonuclease subunit
MRMWGHEQGVALRMGGSREGAFVGIDPGISNACATALYTDADFHAEKFKTQGEGVARLFDLQAKLDEFLAQHEPIACICLEAPITGGVSYGIVPMARAGAAIELLLWELYWNREPHLARPTMVSTSQLKKFVLSKGNGKKAEMLLGVYKQWGHSFRDDNEADSYALAQVAKSVATGEVQFEYQKAVIDRLSPPQDRSNGRHRSRRHQRQAPHSQH